MAKKNNQVKILVITEGPFLTPAAHKILEDVAYTHANLQYFPRDEDDDLKEIPATKVAGFIPEGLYERTPKADFHEALCKALGYPTDSDVPVEDESNASDGSQDDLDDDTDNDDDENGVDFSEMSIEDLNEFCQEHNFEVAKKDRKTVAKYRKAVSAAYANLEA